MKTKNRSDLPEGLRPAQLWSRKHGMRYTKVYQIWRQMRHRCQNKKAKAYPSYGGRGISVCERWSDFRNFYADMGDKPDGLSLDRINNDGNYEPSNCRWATRFEQSQNRRNAWLLTHNGETKCVAEWARCVGFSVMMIKNRIKRGWTTRDALTIEKRFCRDLV